MPQSKQQIIDDQYRDAQKRQKWQADYEDAIDLREANEKQLADADDNSGTDTRDGAGE